MLNKPHHSAVLSTPQYSPCLHHQSLRTFWCWSDRSVSSHHQSRSRSSSSDWQRCQKWCLSCWSNSSCINLSDIYLIHRIVETWGRPLRIWCTGSRHCSIYASSAGGAHMQCAACPWSWRGHDYAWCCQSWQPPPAPSWPSCGAPWASCTARRWGWRTGRRRTWAHRWRRRALRTWRCRLRHPPPPRPSQSSAPGCSCRRGSGRAGSGCWLRGWCSRAAWCAAPGSASGSYPLKEARYQYPGFIVWYFWFYWLYLKLNSVDVESPVLTWKFVDTLESSENVEERDPLLETLLFLLLCLDWLLDLAWPHTHLECWDSSELMLSASRRSWGMLETDFDFLISEYHFTVDILQLTVARLTRLLLCDCI